MYVVERRSTYDMASEFGCDPTTIQKWLEENGISKRPENKEKLPRVWTDDKGYETVRVMYDGETQYTGIHQLIAIAHGADPQKVFSDGDWNCDHKNRITWDNRPCNIQVLTDREHGVKTAEEMLPRHIHRRDQPD